MEYCSWLYKQGRDDEGEKFAHYDLVHESSRILAMVYAPTFPDGYMYSVGFKCHVPRYILRPCCEYFLFVNLEAAKEFTEEILSMFNPFEMGEEEDDEEEATEGVGKEKK